MEFEEKTVSSRPVFKGVIVDLRVDHVRLPNGRSAKREVVSHPGGVCVVPYHDDGTVTVVRQFRYPIGRVITELPAGKLERGEDHRLAGIRELEEETGLTAGEFTYLGGCSPPQAFPMRSSTSTWPGGSARGSSTWTQTSSWTWLQCRLRWCLTWS